MKNVIIPKKFLSKLYKTHKDSIEAYFNRSVKSDDFEAIEQYLYEYEPSIEIFMVEVGVELENNNKEYDGYNIFVNGKEKNYRSLYDENVIAYTDKKEAKDYIESYVKKGVKNTYGFMWKINKCIDELDLEELFETHYVEDAYYRKEEILYFKGGKL
jgi:hypothetical protein